MFNAKTCAAVKNRSLSVYAYIQICNTKHKYTSVCWHTCICICMYLMKIHMHLYLYIFIYTYIYTYIHIYTHVYTYIIIYIYIYIHIHLRKHRRIHIQVHVHVHKHTHANTFTRINTCEHAYTCTRCMSLTLFPAFLICAFHVCMYVRTYARTYACMHACMHACRYVCMYMYVYVMKCMYICIRPSVLLPIFLVRPRAMDRAQGRLTGRGDDPNIELLSILAMPLSSAVTVANVIHAACQHQSRLCKELSS